jgi:tRNA A-37 threonylcarbamoyl transferase component Bud32
MGVVYRALDPAIGRTIAIKTIRLSDLTDPAERERLRDRLFREAQSAGILSHPNIVTIYDILEENGMAYIFMEFVNGPPLEKLLNSDPPRDKTFLLSVLRQTAAALDYAHRKGIVHRDIKPANIMIHEDGTAKITDFGVARILSQQMTQAGMMMGTPSYMSPEQVEGGEVTGRADQFGLAVIAYEILTGEKPFAAEYLPTLLYKICREEPVAPQRLNPTLDPQVDTVFQRALAKAADSRYPTCVEFIDDLERACSLRPGWTPLPRGSSQSLATVATLAPPPAPTPAEVESGAGTPPPPRRPERLEDAETHTVRNAVLAFGALVLIAAGGLIWYQKQYAPPPPAPAAETPPPVAADDRGKPSPVTPAAPVAPAVPAAQQPAPGEQKSVEPPKPAEPKPEVAAKAGSSEEIATPPPPRPRPVQRRTEPAAAPEPDQFITRIVVSPSGAHVVIDGNPALTCESPCSLALAGGRHTLLARLDGYRDANRIFEIPRDADYSVHLERKTGTLSVTSDPPGATILLNGQPRAERTPAVFTLPVGSYRLQVISGNVKTDEETVVIHDGGLSQRRYTLR